jgi:hypothetical protein
MKQHQLLVLFECVERTIENGGNRNEINKTLAELRQEIDFVIRQEKHKTIELNIHRSLELISKLWELLGGT